MTTDTKPRLFSDIVADVKARVAGQWVDLLTSVGGLSADILDGEHHPCPKSNCGGTDRFRLIDKADGAVLCNKCFDRDNGDGFAALQWALGINFKAVVIKLADYFSIPITEPKKKKSGPAFERIRDELQDDVIAIYCSKKPPQTVEAVKAAGGFAVNWPIGYQGDQRCIAFPAVDDCGKVTGHILRRAMGNDFAAYKKTAASKTRMIKGSKDGLVILGEWERVKKSSVSWKVEGVPDAVTLFAHLPAAHAVITNICGAKAVPAFLEPLAGKTLFIVGHADQPGQDGAERWANELAGIAAEVRVVRLPYEITADSGKDVRDFFLDGGTFAQLLALAEAAPVWTPTAEPNEKRPSQKDNRRGIKLTTREWEINNQVIESLSADADLYQRSGQLVTVLYGPKNDDDKIKRHAEAPRIEAIAPATVREKISQHVRFFVEVETEDGVQEIDKFVPDWCPRAVHARGEWDGVRPLAGVVNHPVVTPDGSILTSPGYDSRTGLILDWRESPLVIADRPSRADAVAAVSRLKSLVSDFPFETSAHRAGWLAFLLTVLIRHAFHYAITCPLFLLDANIRGSGKSMLADLVGLIVCGFELARMVLPKDDDEMRKSLLAIAMAGDEIVLLDNVAGELGGASLDAVLTGKRINGRVLGETRQVSVPVNAMFCATSNNAIIVGDLCRRTIHIRLASPLENPEERTGFQIPDIVAHVRQHRRELLTDALTIIRAYIVAGKPNQNLTAMGSFENWSAMVRAPLVWAGESDPWETRVEFAKRADTGGAVLIDLFEVWHEIDPDDKGVTSTEIIHRLQPTAGPLTFNQQVTEAQRLQSVASFRAMIHDLCGCKTSAMPSSKTIGKRLGSLRDRVHQGKKLISRDNGKGSMVWSVVSSDDILPGFRVSSGFISAYAGAGEKSLEELEEPQENEKDNIYGSGAPQTRTNPETRMNPEPLAAAPAVPDAVPAGLTEADRPRNVRLGAEKYPAHWLNKPEGEDAA